MIENKTKRSLKISILFISIDFSLLCCCCSVVFAVVSSMIIITVPVFRIANQLPLHFVLKMYFVLLRSLTNTHTQKISVFVFKKCIVFYLVSFVNFSIYVTRRAARVCVCVCVYVLSACTVCTQIKNLTIISNSIQ